MHVKQGLRKWLCEFFFGISEKIHTDYFLDMCVDLALDTGECGMCSDCEPESCEWRD